MNKIQHLLLNTSELLQWILAVLLYYNVVFSHVSAFIRALMTPL